MYIQQNPNIIKNIIEELKNKNNLKLVRTLNKNDPIELTYDNIKILNKEELIINNKVYKIHSHTDLPFYKDGILQELIN